MSEPVYSIATEAVFNRLPDIYQESDAVQSAPVALAPITGLKNLYPYPSFETAGPVAVVETNYCANPSFEVNTTGWLPAAGGTGTGATLTRDTTEAVVGSASLKVVCDGVNVQQGAYYDPVVQSSLLAGGKFGVQVRVKGTAGVTLEIYAISQGVGNVDRISNVTLDGTWQTFPVLDATLGATKNPYIIVRTRGTAQAATFYIDAAMIFAERGTSGYFDGTTAAGDEFTYAWTGTAHNSTSEKRATSPLGATGGAAAFIHSSDWASTGTKSLRMYSKWDTDGTGYYDLGQYVDWGKTYTCIVKCRIRETLTNFPYITAFTTGMTPNLNVSNGTTALTPGVYDLKITFTMPAFATGADKYLRLYNSNSYGKSVWFDDIAIYEGNVSDGYFSGATPQPSDVRYPANLYTWDGVAHGSTSTRKAYAGDPAGYPLKRYISSVADTLGEVRVLYDRFDYEAVDGDLSHLVNTPDADDAWLDYIAQVLGVGQLRGLTPAQKRTVLVDPSIGYRAGTPESIIAAAATVVSGSGYVGLYKFTTDVSAIGAATMWDILLVTRSGEAVPGEVVQAVIDLGVKPAGVKLYWREWQVTWTAIHTNYPTWASINALPNWAALEKTGI